MTSTAIKGPGPAVFVVFVFIIITFSCTHQAPYRLEPVQSGGITLQHLQTNWGDYFIHYNTRIVVFDPIADTHTIQVGDRWILIEDSKELAAIFSRLGLIPRKGLADIYQIVDSQGILYGYLIYASGDLVSFEKIDENNLRLYYQPQRAPDAP